MGKSVKKTELHCRDRKMKLFISPCLFLLLSCSAQEGYQQNNANIPLDNVGLLHDIFGTSSQNYEGQDGGFQGSGQVAQGPFLGVQPGVSRPDVLGGGEEVVSVGSVSVDRSAPECSSYARLGYECVPYYQCREGNIITDGEGLIDIRFGATPAQDSAILDPSVSKCPGQLEVCCKDPNHVEPPAPLRHQPQCGTRHQNGLFANVQNQGYHPDGLFKIGDRQICAKYNRMTCSQPGGHLRLSRKTGKRMEQHHLCSFVLPGSGLH